MTIREMIDSGKRIEVTLNKKITLPMPAPEDGYKTMNLQGGGTDGRYGYFIENECGSGADVKSRMIKVDLESWEVVGVGENLLMCHANDVAYDPLKNRLLVANCNVNSKILSVVDPVTLQKTGEEVLENGVYAIARCDGKNRFVGGASATYDLLILDENLKKVARYEGEDGCVKQGFEADDDFIYCFQTGARYNWICVYDWDGTYITKIAVPMVGESEHLFRRGDGFIAGFTEAHNGPGGYTVRACNIYEMTFSLTDERDRYRLI